ncbi:glycosyl hydrolase family 35 [Flavobacterium sp. Sd200]|nr:glycosyl hydrolase family 35 [Flavobacterium sp. Sd200]
MKNLYSFICLAIALNTYSQNIYELDATAPATPVNERLKLGGTNPKGDKISVNNQYVSFNGVPAVPVMGEFHYVRYPKKYWEESIQKMKAGGITVIATYVFWNVHEEQEGKFNWEGDKDLKAFIKLCQKNGMQVIVRIGPFCHGEIRSGGLPDWLLGKPLTIRSNDPLYLKYVERLYTQTAKQLKGLYFKNGGPIIGIQIENEYQHSAAPWGLTYPGQPYDLTASERDISLTQEGVGVSDAKNPYAQLGNDHMKILKNIAVNAGIDVPLYTATGWGNAAIIEGESIPVTAGYAYPFWTPKRDYSPFFLYKDMRKVPDYSPVRYNPADYPAFSAELGSGIMSVYTRRPIAVHKSFDAMINRCLGSGANGIGYYMYHGGSTPQGENSYFSDEAYGLPKISYDFQAPVGEYGQVREGFHRLKLLHFFTQDFGHLLAPMQTALPANAALLKPENITDLRYAARVKDNSGFVFINNFQDDTLMLPQKDIRLKIKTAQQEILIPHKGSFNLDANENFIIPFNLDINGITLQYATAQLLAKNDDESQSYYIFFTPKGIKGQFLFNGDAGAVNTNGATIHKDGENTLVTCNGAVSEFTITANGKPVRILVVSKEQALKAYRVTLNGSRHFIFSDAVVLQNGKNLQLLSDGANSFTLDVYPKINGTPKTAFGTLGKTDGNTVFSSYKITLPAATVNVEGKQATERKWTVSLPQSLPEHVNDAVLTINYKADTAMGFIDGKLVTDEFYKGIPWQIGMRKFLTGKPQEMVFYFRPMQKNASYLVDLQPYPESIPDFGGKKEYLKVENFDVQLQYTTNITF